MKKKSNQNRVIDIFFISFMLISNLSIFYVLTTLFLMNSIFGFLLLVITSVFNIVGWSRAYCNWCEKRNKER